MLFRSVAAMAMFASFCLLNLAMKTLPLGTAYGVWTGIGAAGTFVFGAVFLDEPISFTRAAAIICIVGGVALMRISAGDATV